jgi:hypothetical protein
LIANLEAKLQDTLYRQDLDNLVVNMNINYNIDDAAALITEQLLSKI